MSLCSSVTSYAVPTKVLRSNAAAYRWSFVGKCLKMVASLTPAASASYLVVVPLNPWRPNNAMAASMIWALRCAPVIRPRPGLAEAGLATSGPSAVGTVSEP